MANTYTGSAYNFQLTETLIAGNQFHLVYSFDAIPFATALQLQYRVVGAPSWTTNTGSATSPRTITIAQGNYEYQAVVFFSNGNPPATITFSKVVPALVENYIYTPKLNPLIFYAVNKIALPAYQTLHGDEYPHAQRGKEWLQGNSWQQLWQTTDIIYLQFSSTFDPIVIELLNEQGFVVRSWVGLNKLLNKNFNGLYIFEFALSLANLPSGCYKFRRILGNGPLAVLEETCCQYIYDMPVPDSLYIEYKHSSFFKDVVFETGIKFGIRLFGWIDYDKPKTEKKEEGYRNQKYSSKKTSSKSAQSLPVYFGDEMGLPGEITALVEEIFALDEVTIDGAYFTLPADKDFEYTEENGFRMRGMKAMLEPGLNRNSRVVKINTDPQKRLMYGIAVDQQLFGDTSGQGSSNTVPIYNVIIQ